MINDCGLCSVTPPGTAILHYASLPPLPPPFSSFLILVFLLLTLETSGRKNERNKQKIDVKNCKYVRFQVLTDASTKMTAFWNTEPCSLVVVDRRFRDVAMNSMILHGAVSQKAVIFNCYYVITLRMLYRLVLSAVIRTNSRCSSSVIDDR
jgi:hypothetical protein